MSNIQKKPYEISLWEDVNVFSVSNGKTTIEYEGKLPGTEQMDKDFGEGQVDEKTFVERSKKEIFQYYTERKLCVIGSNSMNTPIQAFGANLVENTNGTSTLTFSLYYKYLDENNELIDNPFIGLLVNERKVKLRYGAIGDEDMKWYDFVIKNIQENSENYTFTYTAKNIFINELSKTGFNLEFDTELENNQGTIWELGERILEESDWQLVPEEKRGVVKQYREEPLYEAILKEEITAYNMENTSETHVVGAGSKIYCFYSLVEDQASYLQFLHSEAGYTTDENRVITGTGATNWYIEGVTYSSTNTYNTPVPDFASSIVVSNDYRGKRLVRQQASFYDSTLGQYVYKYTKGEKNYYGYKKSKYISPSVVMNYVVNPSDFVDDTGWAATGGAVLEPTSDPLWQDYVHGGTIISILHTELGPGKYLYNSCLYDNRSGLNNFTVGEEYVIRVKLHKKVDGVNTNPAPTGLKVRIAPYDRTTVGPLLERKEEKEVINEAGETTIVEESIALTEADDYFEVFGKDGWVKDENNSTGYFYARALCTESLSYVDLYNKEVGMFFTADSETSYDFIDVQFFPYVTYTKTDTETAAVTKNVMCVPGGDIEAEIQTQYFYYEAGQDTTDPEAIVYSYKSYTDSPEYVADYNTGFEKVRSITAKESNRFNILQDMCETFECWAEFIIDHDETGKIQTDDIVKDGKTVGRRQRKWVNFREYIGQDNYVGFRYGKNLKSIQRTLDSESIATKLVVKQNSNEFAQDGFCTIARSLENPTRDNFIYDFTYYVNQGMIDFDIVNNDLYLDANGYLGYYKKLKRLNVERDELVDIQAALLTDVSTYDAAVQTWGTAVENANLQLEDKKDEIYRYTGFLYEEITVLLAQIHAEQEKEEEKKEETSTNDSGIAVQSDESEGDSSKAPTTEETEEEKKAREELEAAIEAEIQRRKKAAEDWETNQEFQNIMASIMRLQTSYETCKALYQQAQKNFENANTQYKKNSDRLNEIVEEKLELNQTFYNKYSRYIQEGSWISEDYLDDDLYFIDAESTLYNSAFPKVTYTINVLEVSQLEGFENYKFKIGDKTYIEDTEFFGWNANGRPYQEEVVVNEITVYLDEPDKNVIKVQNYKSSFADLFQRITATTNSVQYSSGAYGRAASIVETDGSISSYTMQMSLANNAYIISNAKDQSVIWDETGITTTSPSDPSNLVRIVNGGVFLSSDGGASWATGITGGGINANYITVGAVDTSKIIIRNNNITSFRWDTYGLSAYSFGYDKDNNMVAYGNGTFVRYDQFGLYGIRNHDSDFIAKTEQDVWDNAQFALTWKGFKLQSDKNNGYVSITSDNDFQVFQGETPRITIGRIGTYTEYIENEGTFTRYNYGIRIADADGAPVMVTKDDGTLWLTNALYVGSKDIGTSDAKVKIGYLEETRKDTDVHEVIHAGDGNKTFIVYEDGKMEATGATFKGTIYADAGQIGSMTIGDVENLGKAVEVIKKFDISSEKGYNFKVGDGGANPTSLTLKATPVGFDLKSDSVVTWQGSNNFGSWEEFKETPAGSESAREYEFEYAEHKDKFINSTYYVRVVGYDTSGKEYINYVTIMLVADGIKGEKGEDAINLVIVSSNGNYFRNNIGETILTAKLYQGGKEIDARAPYSYTYQWVAGEMVISSDSKTITVKADDVDFSKTYICNVSEKEDKK